MHALPFLFYFFNGLKVAHIFPLFPTFNFKPGQGKIRKKAFLLRPMLD